MQITQLAGHRQTLLFLKATTKKQVYIPGFTRHDGSVVKGHMKFVHVTDDHNEAKIASGQGSHSQKVAHAKLAPHAWFQALPEQHKAAVVMAHATDHQDSDSANARASTLKAKILKGEKPTGSEWKAWGYIDPAKRQKLYDEITEAGKGAFFQSCQQSDAIAEGVEARKQRLEHQTVSASEAAEPAPAPVQAEEKPAPVAEAPAEPAAAPAAATPTDVGLTPAELKTIVGPFINSLTVKNFVAKFAAAGDIKNLQMMQSKLIASKTSNGNAQGKWVGQVIAAVEAKQAGKPIAAPEPKPLDHGELNVPGKTNNIDAQLDKHKKEQAQQAAADAKDATAQKKADKAQAQQLYADIGPAMVEQIGAAMKEKGNGDAKTVKAILEDLIKWQPSKFLTMAEKWQKEQAAKPAEEAKTGNPVSAAETGPQEGDTKQGADGTLVLKDGHWIKQGGDEPAATPAAAAAAPGAKPAPQHVLDAIQDAKLPASNVNAKPTNAKLQAIHDHAKAGDVKALLHMGFGVNTYGKLAAKLANKALEAMGSPHKVAHGQKMGAHAGLADMGNPISDMSTPSTQAPDMSKNPAGMSISAAEKPAPSIKQYLLDVENKATMAGKTGLQTTPMIAAAAKEWLAANPGKEKELNDALYQLGYAQMPAAALKEPAAPSLEGKPAYDHMGQAAKAPYSGWDEVLAAGKNWMAANPNGGEEMKEALASLHMPEMAGDLGISEPAPAVADLPQYDAAVVYAPEGDELLAMAAKGDIASINAKISELKAKHFDNTAAYGDKLLEALKAKGITGAPADQGQVGITVADLEKQDAAKPSIKLTDAEIPLPPNSGDTEMMKDGAAYAKKGDIEAVQQLMKEADTAGKPNTFKFLKKLEGAMLAKQGASAPATPVISAADLPPKPGMNFAKNGAIADKLEKMALAGDMQGLMSMQMDDAVQSIGKLSGYAHQLIQALAAKGVGASPALDQGPKDGDTKQGADGMLVFKDGRWHKVGTDPKKLQQLANSIGMPAMSGKYSIKMKATMKNIKACAEEHGGAGLAKMVKILPSGKVKVSTNMLPMKAGMTKQYGWGPLDPDGSQGQNAMLLAKYAKKMLELMDGTSNPTHAAADASATQAAKQAASTPMSDVSPTHEKVGQIKAMIADGWEQTGPQKGSNEGGKFKDKKGQEWYCKFPGDDNVVKNELLAAKFYEMLGAQVPQLRLVKKDGKLGIASKWVDGISKGSAADLAKAPGAHSAFVFDAWLANWDVIGLSNDNLMLGKDGKAVRVDVGGSLVYRAQGGEKGAAFGNEVTELQTLLDAGKNSNSAAVFKGISQADLAAGAEVLAKMRDGQIKKMVDLFGPGDDAAKASLTAKLIARRADILAKLGIADPWNLPPPDKSALPVNPADIPKPIDFNNYNDSGKGLSSKKHVNDLNTKDDAALLAAAAKGDLLALKAYQYDAVDKETGAPIGKKPIIEHPNKDIKQHWAECVQLLESIASPSVMGLAMPPLGSGSIDDVSQEAGFYKPGERPDTIPADKRLGYWMKLASAGDDFMDLVPKKQNWVTEAAKNAAKASFSKVKGITKAFISAVQATGWINHVFSDGSSTVTADGNGGHYSGGLSGMAQAIYSDAIEQPEGTTVSRWMQMPEAMKKQLLAEKPGLIFQNTDSMCTSMAENWETGGGFGGGAFLEIVYAKGAKATHSHASGAFKSEQEITTLPGARFMLLEAKQGNKKGADGIRLKLLMLPPHEGYVAELDKQATMGKSFFGSILGAFKGGLNA